MEAHINMFIDYVNENRQVLEQYLEYDGVIYILDDSIENDETYTMLRSIIHNSLLNNFVDMNRYLYGITEIYTLDKDKFTLHLTTIEQIYSNLVGDIPDH